MPDFLGRATILIQSTTRKLPVSMTFAVCSSATANDGAIPYGDSIASAVVKSYGPTGTETTSSFVTTAATVAGNVVNFKVGYYTGIVAGKHKLTAILTMASGYIDEFDLARVIVGDQ